jgi:hypothetical protein
MSAASKSKQSGTDSLIAVLKARKTSTEVLSSANIRVRNALKSEDDEARRVIFKEIKRMVVRQVFPYGTCEEIHDPVLDVPQGKVSSGRHI